MYTPADLKLYLLGTSTSVKSLPSLPCLISLCLYKVRIPHLYALLKGCAGSLEHLTLGEISNTAPPEVDLPPSRQTCLPRLLLPKITTIQVSSLTFSLWDQSREHSSDFAIRTPNLIKASFAPFIRNIPPEIKAMNDAIILAAEVDEDLEYSTFVFRRSIRSLRLSAASRLEELDLRGIYIDDPTEILDLLEEISPTLHTLSLPQACPHGLIKRLGVSLPSLRTLRIDGIDTFIPILATLARSLELARQGEDDRLAIYISPSDTPISSHQVEATKTSFGEALRHMSADQLDFILDDMDDSATPGADSRETLVREVKSLWRKSFPANSGQ